MKNNKRFILICILILVVLLVIGFFFLKGHLKQHVIPTEEEKKPTEYSAVKVIDVSEIVNYGTSISKKVDESAYLVKKESMLTLRNSSISKADGDSSDIDKSLDTGLNSAILITYGCIGKIETSKVVTQVEGAAGVYANGQKAEVTIKDTTIETYQTYSSNIVATNNSSVEGEHLILNTKVKNSPALRATIGGTIKIHNSNIETNGSGSPIIYSRGTINLSETTGNAYGSRFGIIESGGVATINSSTFLVSGGSNDENYKESAVLMIPGEKDKRAIFSASNSSLNLNQSLPYYRVATFFIVDGVESEINLKNTSLNFGSDSLIVGTNSKIHLNADNQLLHGNITLDESSSIEIKMINNSSYTGSLNSNQASLYISKDSELNLTGDTYVKEFLNDNPSNDNVITNGYHLYANNELIK